MIYLTSFRRYHELSSPDPAYSIAVYQPRWLPQLPETRVFDIRDDRGRWTRPRDFIPDGHDPTLPDDELLGRYSDALMALYQAREVEIAQFLNRRAETTALCCWCPYDAAAKRQLHDYGSFVCHSAVVEVYLKGIGLEVVRDQDRERMVRL